MDQKVLNLLATVSAELNALGDDENSGLFMSAVEWLFTAYGMPDEAFDQANEVFISMRDKTIADIPSTIQPDEAVRCIAALHEGSDELLAGSRLLTECFSFLRDYWSELLQSPE